MMNRRQMIAYLLTNVSLVEFANGNFSLPMEKIALNETPWRIVSEAGITKVWCKKMGSAITETNVYLTKKPRSPVMPPSLEEWEAEQIAMQEPVAIPDLEHAGVNMNEIPLIDESVLDHARANSPWNTQIGGTHYTDKAMQPLQLTLVNRGYGAFSGACYTKINKYTTRAKDDEVEQLKKARHVLDLWIYEAEKNKVGAK